MEKLSNPLFTYGHTLPDGVTPAMKITGKEQADIVLQGKDGTIGGAVFLKGKYLVIPVFFDDPHCVNLIMRFYENYGQPEEVHSKVAYGLLPHFLHYVTVDLRILDMTVPNQPRVPGSLTFMYTNSPTRCEKLDALVITIPKTATERAFYMGEPYLADEPPKQPLYDGIYVDRLGQWALKEWKGKTANEEEMIKNYRKWLAEAQEPGEGYRNSKGFFKVEKRDGFFHLIDPDGLPFFSVGPDCVYPSSAGPIGGFEKMIEELPPKDGLYAECWNKKNVDFLKANLIKAFGETWHKDWTKLTAHRLKEWGFNTVANWADADFRKNSGLPYVIEPWLAYTERNIFRDLPDVFSPEYEENSIEHAKILKPYKNDKNLIGYFMRNEPSFAFGDFNLTLYMLKSDFDSYSKREFIKDMTEKYGDIANFNDAWGTVFADYEAIKTPWPWDVKLTPAGEEDSNIFNRKLVSKYIEVPAKAFRAVAPNHLNLGLRWAFIVNDFFYGGSEFIDVFSLNSYSESLKPERIAEISQKAGGKPVIIGEFHTGALDAGLPTNGICSSASQNERGVHYSYYVENGATLPELIGAHYFQYNDQPLLGRGDGENCNVGFIDVCGKPHTEMMEHVVETNARVMDIRLGKIKPTDRRPVIVPIEGYCS
jgi:hypothetical protein